MHKMKRGLILALVIVTLSVLFFAGGSYIFVKAQEIPDNYYAFVVMDQTVFLRDSGSTYGLSDLTERTDSTDRQEFYGQLNDRCFSFSLGTEDASPKEIEKEVCYTAFRIPSYGLSKDEAVECYITFRNDNPQYFWLDSRLIWSENTVTILAYEEFASGQERKETLEEITDNVCEYLASASMAEDRYSRIRSIHDHLVRNVSYQSGTDAAHSIAGPLTSRQTAVCEGYAKTMQLLMNLLDIPNIYVTGTADGEGHAWNMTWMDNGSWYLIDATWNDRDGMEPVHNYFLAGSSPTTEHIPDRQGSKRRKFLYPIPDLAENDYVKEE